MSTKRRPSVYLVLLHHPISNRHGAVVTTSVTNLDIHDISRSARTYGVKRYFIVTPVDEQRELVGRILGHWSTDLSKDWHPDRVAAVSRVEVVKDFEAVKTAILQECGEPAEVLVPDARPMANAVGYAELRRELENPERTRPAVIVLGTGWGISELFYPEVHRFLAPINGPTQVGESEHYNHLSVRAAAAAILDRLFGDRS